MRYLVILILLLVLFAFILSRLRPYIALAQKVLGIVKDARNVAGAEGAGSVRQSVTSDQKLLRCATCKTWIPESRAVRLRSQSTAYCSHQCLENAATNINTRRAAGGSQ